LLNPMTFPNGSKSAKGGSGASVAMTSRSPAASTGRSAVGRMGTVGAGVAFPAAGSGMSLQAAMTGNRIRNRARMNNAFWNFIVDIRLDAKYIDYALIVRARSPGFHRLHRMMGLRQWYEVP